MSGNYSYFEAQDSRAQRVWNELFLEEASKAVRLVAGCVYPPPVPAFPPAPRLVGVEPNPGPSRSRAKLGSARTDATASALAGLGGSLAALMSRAKKKKTKPKSRPQSSSSSEAIAYSNVARRVTAPASVGVSVRGARRSTATHVVPFRCTTMRVESSATGFPQLVSLATAVPLLNIALDPQDADSIFGGAMNRIAIAYTQWRVKKLRITYRPTCPTSTAGGFALAYAADGRYPDSSASGPATAAQALSCPASFCVSPWVQTEMPNLDAELDTTWKFVSDATGGASAANYYLQHAGMVFPAATGGLANSTVLGVLEFSGEVEFAHLQGLFTAPSAKVAAASVPPLLANSSSSVVPPQPSVPQTPRPEYELVQRRAGWLG